MTSFAFMLAEVPAPPWMTSTMNCSCSSPERTSSQALMIAAALSGGSRSRSRLAAAAACFTDARALTRSGYVDIAMPEMRKFSEARRV